MPVNIHVPKDCDKAPKRRLIRDLRIAFIKKDIDFIQNHLAPDIILDIVGAEVVTGIDQVLNHIKTAENEELREFTIAQLISHGKFAASNGSFVFQKKTFAFADHYEFTSAGSSKIKKITSYIIQV
ncbi:nuclear transport factor 2 family protein [Olivibacter sp. SDN3]|uniref:nuclear transport factor 2 family protein n=1 Tax=Olivibacter sp. SDN3 TaxID=2764720 RepID=UPI0016518797|nr:nuclear transport factor 2 family protein [Olivibacter sp. SDN3]QNL48211.1 nuclear transport factor 2 family protein [Olivibacter sp. SDN3]